VSLKPIPNPIQFIHNLQFPIRKDLIAVRDRARRPLREQMTRARTGQLRSHDNRISLPLAIPHEKNQPAVVRNTLNNPSRPSQMRSRLFERNNMNSLPNPLDISCISRVPARRMMPHVRLARHQQF
jgi:hypothetical protein